MIVRTTLVLLLPAAAPYSVSASVLKCRAAHTSNAVMPATAASANPTLVRSFLRSLAADASDERSTASPPTRAQSHPAGRGCVRIPIPDAIWRRPYKRSVALVVGLFRTPIK